MSDYSQMTRAELIERLRALEGKATTVSNDFSVEHKLAQSAWRNSEERIRAILHTAVEGIITIDNKGIIESANPAAERIFGYSASEIIGKNVSILMPSPYREEHDTYLQNYSHTGKAKIIGIGREVVGQRKDGSVFPMDLSVGEVNLAGERLYTGIVRDVTTRKESEHRLEELANSLAEKNKELETIVYVASHDLRSPLVNIQGFSKELEQACARLQTRLAPDGAPVIDGNGEVKMLLEEDIPEALEFIKAGVEKIEALLSGFLRFSRLGRAAIRIERLNMNSIVNNIVDAMVFQIKQTGVHLEKGTLPECYGDATLINQVFSNLLENALKYLDPRRPGVITISGKVEEGQAVYSVRDNGIGIASEHLTKVFEIFHRLNPSIGEGEGLGLTIAQKIMERHDGKIWVESTPGVGSAFFVSLPTQLRKNWK